MLRHTILIFTISVFSSTAVHARSAICEVFDATTIGVQTISYLTDTNVVSFSVSLLHSPSTAEYWEHICTDTMCARDGPDFTEFIQFDWTDLTWIEQARFYSDPGKENTRVRQVMQCYNQLGGSVVLGLE